MRRLYHCPPLPMAERPPWKKEVGLLKSLRLGDGHCTETVSEQDQTAATQQLRLSTQHLHWVKGANIPAWEWEGLMRPRLPKELWTVQGV